MASVTVTPSRLLLTTTLLSPRVDPLAVPKLVATTTLMTARVTTPSTPTGANRAQGHGRSSLSVLRRVGL